MDLSFKYSAIGLFCDKGSRRTELRVILLDATNRDSAVKQAEYMMRSYARDFEMEYQAVVNVFEAGTDMLSKYGEIFSLNWETDPVFDARLMEVIEDEP